LPQYAPQFSADQTADHGFGVNPPADQHASDLEPDAMDDLYFGSSFNL